MEEYLREANEDRIEALESEISAYYAERAMEELREKKYAD